MFDKLVRHPDITVDDLDPDDTLNRAADLQTVTNLAGVALLATALHWADLHGVLEEEPGRCLPGAARLIRIGGLGTPEVDDLAIGEFAAVLRMSDGAGWSLIADALDLRHRLPRLWDVMQTGQVPDWVGRRVARTTRHLTHAVCALVDVRAAFCATRMGPGPLFGAVDAAIIAADPQLAAERARRLRDDHGVWVNPTNDAGTKTMVIKGATPDLIMFDATVDHTADSLGLLGSTDSKDQRRARAIGVLASPQQALNLFADAAAIADAKIAAGQPFPADVTIEPIDLLPPDDVEAAREAASVHDGHAGHDCQARSKKVDPRPRAVLYVHLAADTLADLATGKTPAHPVARIEDIGPVCLDQTRRWLRDLSVTVKPVIDLNQIPPADCYEIPARIREAVHLTRPTDAAPWATRIGRSGDLDHTDPYRPPDEGGPPGQTSLGNLAPLSRRMHRAKTHGRWDVKQPFPGVYLWRSRRGRIYLVDQTGTRQLK